jgi:hypothetical protein
MQVPVRPLAVQVSPLPSGKVQHYKDGLACRSDINGVLLRCDDLTCMSLPPGQWPASEMPPRLLQEVVEMQVPESPLLDVQVGVDAGGGFAVGLGFTEEALGFVPVGAGPLASSSGMQIGGVSRSGRVWNDLSAGVCPIQRLAVPLEYYVPRWRDQYHASREADPP